MLVLDCSLNLFLIYKKIENWDLISCSSQISEFFPIHEQDETFGFLNVSLS